MRGRFLIWVISLIFLAGCSYPALAPSPPDPTADPTLSENTPDPTHLPVALSPSATDIVEASTPSPPEASELNTPLYGVHIDDFVSIAGDNLLQGAYVKWSRFSKFHWDAIEPVNTDPSSFDWSTVDEENLRIASENGIQIISAILFSPEWAQKYPGSVCGPIIEGALGEFANFMQELVSRYSQPPYNIKYWEIGNEPDVNHTFEPSRAGFGCWGESGDPYYGGGYYAEMLKVVYPQIKAVDPESQVLVGGLLLDCDPLNPPESQPGSGQPKDCTPAKFLEGILANGGGDYFDGVSFHGYDYYAASLGKYSNGNWHSSWDTTGPVLIAKANYLRDLLTQYGYPDRYLLNTENAILCGRDGTEDVCQVEEFSLTKAYYLAQAFAAARAEGLRANIWYSMRGWRGSGLVNSELHPNLALQAFKFSAEQLEGAAYSGEVTRFPGIKGYEFTREGTHTWLLWAQDDQTHFVTLPEVPDAVYDVFGAPSNMSQELPVTLAPVYIQWTP
jgi:hypothetical protein